MRRISPSFAQISKIGAFLKGVSATAPLQRCTVFPFLTTYRVKDWRHESLRVLPSLFEKDPQNGAFKFDLFSSF